MVVMATRQGIQWGSIEKKKSDMGKGEHERGLV